MSLPADSVFHGERSRSAALSPFTSVHPGRGSVSRHGCAVASEPAIGGLREESSRLDRLPVAKQTDAIGSRRELVALLGHNQRANKE
jgi:hypothetical protein